MADTAVQRLRDAAQRGDVVRVQLLLATGWLPYDTSVALKAAVRNDHVTTVAWFREWRLQHSATHSDDMYLDIAMRHGSLHAAAFLISVKAHVEGDGSNTPLITAAVKGHLACVSLLLAAKARAHVPAEQTTALHCAAVHGHTDVVECLVRAKAGVHSRDLSGKTPVSLAVKNRHEPALKVLLDAHPVDDLPVGWCRGALVAASRLPWHPGVFRLLLDARADVHDTVYWGEAALSVAIEQGCPEIAVKLLLRAKANVLFADEGAVTALHKAAQHGRRRTVELLVRAKADVHAVNACGNTAATIARWNKHVELAEFLQAIITGV
jgi:ankyrin repeat protein